MAICETCPYWKKASGAMGECHRFPQPHRTSYASFCGEHPNFGKPDDEVDHEKDVVVMHRNPPVGGDELELGNPNIFTHDDLPGKEYKSEGAMKRALTMKAKKNV